MEVEGHSVLPRSALDLKSSHRSHVVKIFGLDNPAKANLCYVNSTIQSLFGLGVLPFPLGRYDSQQFALWHSLEALWKRVTAPEFVSGESVPGGPMLGQLLGGPPGEQQDAHEFLMKLVERLDEEAKHAGKAKKKKKKKSAAGQAGGWAEVSKTGSAVQVTTLGVVETQVGPMMEAFGVLLQSSKKNKKILEPSLGISLPLTDTWDVDLRKMRFNKLPLVLVIHLVRPLNRKGRLAHGQWDFERILSVDQLEVDEEKDGLRKKVSYSLRAMVLHAGETLHQGHYICRCKDTDGDWTQRDDRRLSRISRPWKDLEPFVPYLLFYLRED